MTGTERTYSSVEICAGAGGQAVGLHNAGFVHTALIEIDPHACRTLESNTAGWGKEREVPVLERDLTTFTPSELDALVPEGGLDLLAGGVPCPPFSHAGKQLGQDDERDLFPTMLDMVDRLRPRAVMIENVRGLLEPEIKFASYREYIKGRLAKAGYKVLGWDVLEARDFGVPQLRPRSVLVAMQKDIAPHFKPFHRHGEVVTVAEALDESMWARLHKTARGRRVYEQWKSRATERGTVAPTLVGGSKKHGGADLGPTRAKRAWLALGVDAHGVADDPSAIKDPERDLFGPRGPKLTVQQAALIQGFPPDWKFVGRKTAAYRQVGNAFPPPVAQAVGEAIIAALRSYDAKKPGGELAETLVHGSAPKQLAFAV